jgi:hypothetical protein
VDCSVSSVITLIGLQNGSVQFNRTEKGGCLERINNLEMASGFKTGAGDRIRRRLHCITRCWMLALGWSSWILEVLEKNH